MIVQTEWMENVIVFQETWKKMACIMTNKYVTKNKAAPLQYSNRVEVSRVTLCYSWTWIYSVNILWTGEISNKSNKTVLHKMIIIKLKKVVGRHTSIKKFSLGQGIA